MISLSLPDHFWIGLCRYWL